jgi:hypothetical protein
MLNEGTTELQTITVAGQLFTMAVNVLSDVGWTSLMITKGGAKISQPEIVFQEHMSEKFMTDKGFTDMALYFASIKDHCNVALSAYFAPVASVAAPDFQSQLEAWIHSLNFVVTGNSAYVQ